MVRTTTQLVTIRHGDVEPILNDEGKPTIYGPDAKLSDLGRKQMEQLGSRLDANGITLDVLYVSPFRRAQESATAMIGTRKIPRFTLNELRDVHAPGWVGKSFDELQETGGDVYKSPLSTDQESLFGLTRRARYALEDATSGLELGRIGIISHGDLLSALVWQMTHDRHTEDYKELVKNFYLEKGQANVFEINLEGKIVRDEGKISTETSLHSIEGFRGSPERR